MIDGFMHPLARGERKVSVLLADAALHALVEQNLRGSFASFIKYTAPKIMGEMRKQRKSRAKQQMRAGSRARREREYRLHR
jgi:protein required for attachment to host cells